MKKFISYLKTVLVAPRDTFGAGANKDRDGILIFILFIFCGALGYIVSNYLGYRLEFLGWDVFLFWLMFGVINIFIGIIWFYWTGWYYELD